MMRRGFALRVVATLAITTAFVLVIGSSGAIGRIAIVQHGMSLSKGCDSPTKIGDPVSCSYTALTGTDQAHDSSTIWQLIDTVDSIPPDVSGNLLNTASLTTTTVDTGNVQSGSVCYQLVRSSGPQNSAGDMSVTNGSGTVTSASANFTAADIGREIYIRGTVYSIAGVTNGTTATISPVYGFGEQPSAAPTGINRPWIIGKSTTQDGNVNAGGAYTNSGFCNLPFGSQVNVLPTSHHTATANDFANGPALTDAATLNWFDVCDGTAAGGGPGSGNCSQVQPTVSAGSSTTVEQLTATVTTQIHDAAHQVVTVVGSGATVHDFVAVTGQPARPVPTGNVELSFFTNNTCAGSPAATSGPVGPLNGSGQFDATGFAQGPLVPGLYGFQATYDGDPTYAPSNPGACEPLRVVDANIHLTPATATNPTGTNHVLTCHINVNDGSGGGYVNAPDGTTCTVTIISGPGGPATQNCTVSGGAGNCQVTITSAVTGTSVIQAATDVSVAGLVLHRQTGDANPGDGPNAQKDWVNANINITPATAANQVGTNHVLTITVNAIGGTIDAGPHTATASILSGPGIFVGSPSCTYTGGAATASCTVTISSAVVGQTVVQATSDIPVNGVTITRTTGTAANTASGGSGNASKNWVDANINITPATAANEIGTNHVLTITVNALGGTIDAGPHTATASILSGPGGFVGPASCTYTGGGPTASCTVTITSTTPGQTVVQATSNIPVMGVSITKTTGTAGNTASGGSGNASKNWVDANIQISPATAVNPTGTNHTLHCHINVNTGGGAGYVSAPDGTVCTVTITSGPGTPAAQNCTTSGGTGTCDVVITSSTVGTTTVNAATNVSVMGVVLHRSTNGVAGNSGPATKNWVDANINITPANATNPVGTQHVLTITVNALGGTIDPGPHTATASIVSGPGTFVPAVGGNTCTYTGGAATASCQVTITSAVAGTTVVQATSNIPVSGVVITRTTGTAANTASGGSGNASKLWLQPDANIQLTPATATNAVGTNHVLTCHVNISHDSTTYSNAPDGTVCTVTITAGPGTPSPQNCTTSGGTGSCTVTITSATAGTTTLNASTTVSVDGSVLNRTTNGTAGNSGPAQKAWVDANIQISPPTATNATGTNHVLTITVNAINGTIDAGPHTATASILSGPGGFVGSPSCTYTGGAATASCTVTITSNATGTTVVQATSNIPVSGQVISRTTATNPGPGGSGNASKVWVDANIQISPPTATNPVGTNHVLTITVNALGGTLDAGPHTATASILSGPGGFVGSPSCTYTGGAATASCTVTITSNAAGTTVVQATSNIPVNGQTIPRTTASNPGPGGSGNASKLWLSPDANIQLTPGNAENPVGTNHVLTCHINVSPDSSTYANAPDGTVCTVTITSGPGTPSPQNCTTSGGTGSCTVTITSATAGTTILNASTTITVNGIVLTRTTNGSAGNSGPATKLWGDDTVTTNVRDAGGVDITNNNQVAPGTVVHDEATVAKTAGTPASVQAPTGTVDFTLFQSMDCTGTVLQSDPGKPLNAAGLATSATFTVNTSGAYSYRAHYNGDANYPPKDAGCEPFTVAQPFGPRLTPGFWKNHQAATTALLPITLGNYVVDTFAKASAIFDAMKCSSPIDCLAGHELAAKLDLAGGSDPVILPVIAQADALLIQVNYNGPGNYTPPTKAQKALALQLEQTIDSYTNQ
jgi:hypothetical protein